MAVEVQPEYVLSKQAVEQFERDGYFIIEDAFPEELLDRVVADFEPMYRDAWDEGPDAGQDGVYWTRYPGWEIQGYHWHRIKNAWKIRDSARAVALAPKALAITEQLFGRSVLPFQTLNFPVGTQQPAHMDSAHFQSDPAGLMCGIWVALEDMDMDNGPLLYYPGSHKLPPPTIEEVERVVGEHIKREDHPDWPEFMSHRHRLYSQYCKLILEQEGFEPEYGTIRKGQALLWAPNLLHGGAVQNDKARTRHSQVTHYFFEGTRVYTPLHSVGEHVHWDYPEWIRDPVPEFSLAFLQETIGANVPAGATLVVASEADPELLQLEDYEVRELPQLKDPEAGQFLERLHGEGAEYAVFPKPSLIPLEWRTPGLQELLENNHRAVMRDGAVAAIYALN
jgi:Phytanoyl-CoA dioxygenase (PhyH)